MRPRRRRRAVPDWACRRPACTLGLLKDPEGQSGPVGASQVQSGPVNGHASLAERLAAIGKPADNPQTRALRNGTAPPPRPAPSVPGQIVAGDVLEAVLERARGRVEQSEPHSAPEPASGPPGPPTACRGPSEAAGRPARPQVRGEPDPEAVEALCRLADELHPGKKPGDEFSGYVRRLRRAFPLDWIEQALLVTAAHRDPPRTFNPVFNLLDSWRSSGGPPAPRPVEALPDLRQSGGASRAEREAFLRQYREGEPG
jgi:hypothetical protein